MTRIAQVRGLIQALFPERHLYLRSGGEMKGVVLSPGRQMFFAALVLGAIVWIATSSIAIAVGAFTQSRSDRELARMQARSERWVADREARLNSAVAQLNASGATLGGLAETIEKRHIALALLLTDLRGEPGAMAALSPALRSVPNADASPVERIAGVQANQERLADAANDYARGRADRLRLAFRLAGLSPSSFASPKASGGPLLEAPDARALAAVLDVDERFAERIQHAAENLSVADTLSEAASQLPFAQPQVGARTTSSFGVRFDPFTGRPAFHSGLDFGSSFGSPVMTTAPGVVSFAFLPDFGYNKVGGEVKQNALVGIAVAARGQPMPVVRVLGCEGRVQHLHHVGDVKLGQALVNALAQYGNVGCLGGLAVRLALHGEGQLHTAD
jgi:murein DD-endopeptidase MepM/ murein hydrolase activator NlpD